MADIALRTEPRSTETIFPTRQNPRRHSFRHIKQIARSIEPLVSSLLLSSTATMSSSRATAAGMPPVSWE
jgi:hypothetical protein